jgi:uncharacterized protein involved in exopolysaccharide biosynthesis
VADRVETTDMNGVSSGMAAAIRDRWQIIVATPAVLVGLVLLYQTINTPKYTARVVVTAQAPSTSLGGQLGRLGGFAALAGASLGKSADVTEFDKFQFMLKSELLGTYQAGRGILPVVFAEKWDAQRQEWRRPNGVAQSVKDTFFPAFGLKPWLPPDGRSLAEHYNRQLVLREVGETGMIELAFEDSDPQRAIRVLRTMVEDSNELLRAAAANRAAQKAAYLRQQLAIAQVAEYRTNLASLLANEEQVMTLSSTKLPFAADIVEPYTVSAQPTSQRPFLYAIIAIIVGLSLGTFLALLLGPRRIHAAG